MAAALRPVTRKRGALVWAPQPGPQTALLECPIQDVFYGGARGGGKSDGLLGDFMAHAHRHGKYARGVIFRRTYPELEEVERRAGDILPRLGWRRNVTRRTWTAPNGARLALRYLDNDNDADGYLGHEYSWLGFDELVNWPSSVPFDKLLGTLRSPHGVPCVRRSTGNPGGIGHNWVKARYIDPSPPFVPFTGTDGQRRVFIPARVEDNRILLDADPDYVHRLEASGPSWLVDAWLHGKWDIVAGGMFDDVFKREVHVLKPFAIPSSWRIDRSFDWGSARPFSVGWWAESDGTQAPNGKTYPRGSVFRIAEWYGWNGKANEGARMAPADIARGILEFEREDAGGLGFRDKQGRTRVQNGPADSSIFAADYGASIADDMARVGVHWEKADKQPGSRCNGWEKVRGMLRAALVGHVRPEGPARPIYTPADALEATRRAPEDAGLYVFDTCVHWLRTVPTLPRDPRKLEDVDTDAEDHAGDESRYRLMRRKPAGLVFSTLKM